MKSLLDESLHPRTQVRVTSRTSKLAEVLTSDYALWDGDSEKFLQALPAVPVFDLVVTSPPYNI